MSTVRRKRGGGMRDRQLHLWESVSETDIVGDEYDPLKDIFDRVEPLLVDNKKKKGQTKQLVAMMVKRYGEDAVLRVITLVEKDKPLYPLSYMLACLKNATGTDNDRKVDSTVAAIRLARARSAANAKSSN